MLIDARIVFGEAPESVGGTGISLVYAGCRRALAGKPCPGCHNPWLWNFGGDDEARLRRPFAMTPDDGMSCVDYVSVVGGEPFDQEPSEVVGDIETLKAVRPELVVVVYTGYDSVEEAAAAGSSESYLHHPLVVASDFIKTGRYDPSVPATRGSRLASGNQKMLRVLRDESGSVVGFEEIAF